MDNTDSVNLGGVNFESDVEWKKDTALNPNNDDLAEALLNISFHAQKDMLN